MKVYTPETLAEANGKDGRDTLVAVGGKVYDISSSKKWIKGTHMKRHQAGADLSSDINSAPHGPEVLERFELVGTLEEAPEELHTGLRGKVEVWLDKNPFFRRHPHPAVVHVPVGLLVVLPLFEILGLAFASPYMEWAAFCCLVVAVLAIPAAIATGYFTWWVNYDAEEFATVRTKRRLAWVSLLLGIVAVLVRAVAVDNPLRLGDPSVIVYLVALFGLSALVGGVGFLGGKLTFPYDSH